MDLDKFLEDTNTKLGYVLEKLYCSDAKLKLCDKNRIITVTPIFISKGKGFVSRIFRIIIEYENDSTFSFIVKIPTKDFLQGLFNSIFDPNEFVCEPERLQAGVDLFHGIECQFYEHFSSAKLPLPKVYFAQKPRHIDPGLLIMEDFHRSITIDLFTPYTKEQLDVIFVALTQFHIYQMKHETKPWVGKYDIRKYFEVAEPFELKLTPKILKIFKEFNTAEYGLLVDKLLKLFGNLNFKELAYSKCCDKLELPKMVCHGDLWGANILWDDKCKQLLAFIDFANIFEGNPMFDFAMILTCTDTQTRKIMERNLVKNYLLAIQEAGLSSKFEVENFQKAYGLAQAYCATRMSTAATFHKDLGPNESPEEHAKKLDIYLTYVKDALKDAVNFLEKEYPAFFVKHEK